MNYWILHLLSMANVLAQFHFNTNKYQWKISQYLYLTKEIPGPMLIASFDRPYPSNSIDDLIQVKK